MSEPFAWFAPPEGRGDFACARCGERFARERYLALHAGRAHAGSLSDTERATLSAAVAEDDAWLVEVRRRSRGGLAALPALVWFMAAWVIGYVFGLGPEVVFLPLLPVVGFSVLFYLVVAGSRSADGRAR